MVHINKK